MPRGAKSSPSSWTRVFAQTTRAATRASSWRIPGARLLGKGFKEKSKLSVVYITYNQAYIQYTDIIIHETSLYTVVNTVYTYRCELSEKVGAGDFIVINLEALS